MKEEHIEFWKMELSKLIDILNSTQNIRLQLGIFFAIANLSGIMFAFSSKTSLMILLSGSIMFLFMFADLVMVRTIYGYYYRAIRILTEKFSYSEESIFDMFMLFIRIQKIKIIHEIIQESDNITRYKKLRQIPFRHPTVLGFWMPLAIFVIELSLSGYLFYCQHWSFF